MKLKQDYENYYSKYLLDVIEADGRSLWEFVGRIGRDYEAMCQEAYLFITTQDVAVELNVITRLLKDKDNNFFPKQYRDLIDKYRRYRNLGSHAYDETKFADYDEAYRKIKKTYTGLIKDFKNINLENNVSPIQVNHNANMKEYWIGIDLGTTNSSVGYMGSNGKPVIIKIKNNELLPSQLFFEENSDIPKYYGEDAFERGEKSITGRYYKEFKRKMGTDEPDRGFKPTELSTFLLSYMKQAAEQKITDGEVVGAVVTVPADFGARERIATKTAALDAGFSSVKLLNEPSAAALAFANESEEKIKGNVLVYDLGGGTFDVTILHTDDGIKFTTLVTAGNKELGGKNFDDATADILIKKFEENDYHQEKSAQFLHEVKRLKEGLTFEDVYDLNAVQDQNGKTIQIGLTKEEFERDTVIRELAEKTISKLEQAFETGKNLQKIQNGWGDINAFVMTGGSCNLPIIQRTLRNIDGIGDINSDNLDTLVVRGAIIYSDWINKGKYQDKLKEVTSKGLGVIYRQNGKEAKRETIEEYDNNYIVDIVVPPFSEIGTKGETKGFAAADNYTRDYIEIVEASDNRPSLASHPFKDKEYSFELSRPRNEGESVDFLSFTFDEDQILSVDVYEMIPNSDGTITKDFKTTLDYYVG